MLRANLESLAIALHAAFYDDYGSACRAWESETQFYRERMFAMARAAAKEFQRQCDADLKISTD